MPSSERQRQSGRVRAPSALRVLPGPPPCRCSPGAGSSGTPGLLSPLRPQLQEIPQPGQVSPSPQQEPGLTASRPRATPEAVSAALLSPDLLSLSAPLWPRDPQALGPGQTGGLLLPHKPCVVRPQKYRLTHFGSKVYCFFSLSCWLFLPL